MTSTTVQDFGNVQVSVRRSWSYRPLQVLAAVTWLVLGPLAFLTLGFGLVLFIPAFLLLLFLWSKTTLTFRCGEQQVAEVKVLAGAFSGSSYTGVREIAAVPGERGTFLINIIDEHTTSLVRVDIFEPACCKVGTTEVKVRSTCRMRLVTYAADADWLDSLWEKIGFAADDRCLNLLDALERKKSGKGKADGMIASRDDSLARLPKADALPEEEKLRRFFARVLHSALGFPELWLQNAGLHGPVDWQSSVVLQALETIPATTHAYTETRQRLLQLTTAAK